MEEKWIHKFDYVNSSYILQYIFSFLEETKKLYIIINNKAIQNRIEVDLDYYKKISGKYKEVGENGIGKVYRLDDNKLIFEGECKNGKKNGKGKEFYELGYVKFEGEYINGEKIKGKGYNTSGKVIMEIDNGKGKEYYNNGQIIFEGEYLDDKRWNGKIKEYKKYEFIAWTCGCGRRDYKKIIKEENIKKKLKEYKNLLKYEGEYLNEKRNGKGKEYDIRGNIIFEGEYLNDKRQYENDSLNQNYSDNEIDKYFLVYEGDLYDINVKFFFKPTFLLFCEFEFVFILCKFD